MSYGFFFHKDGAVDLDKVFNLGFRTTEITSVGIKGELTQTVDWLIDFQSSDGLTTIVHFNSEEEWRAVIAKLEERLGASRMVHI